ncbi:inositol 2-dehydrogenase [Rhodobacteraceae bacterium N5(2021)]|uniref:Inositol 2-dehydrogenase n=1 Tax=Gymnodinialimonas phycosphaerae TaxID=2841589 RepID=A0A975TV66_9RHOB|nr:inositol 2-dehydrogenase [Gymnodinialimonas phycosphaerae]MBY4891281.1 inositol 2-dehydrogenase [Gymnodinialimonas phycosphaerae]
MLKIGLLGCGRIGQVHARTIKGLEHAKIVAVADAVPAAAESLATALAAEVREPDAVLSATDIDAVIIGTPTSTHFEQIQAAAESSKAIFCEKPVDMSVDNIRILMDVTAKANVPFFTAFNRRFDPNFAALQARLRAGEIGAVELIQITSRDPSPPPIGYIKTSGGLFRDMMIHDFDMARFLMGEEFTMLSAVGSCLVDPEIGEAGDVDTAAVILTTASGRICQISNSRRASYGYDQRIEVHGALGMLRAENILETSVEVATAEGFRRAPTLNFFLERYEAAYAAEMKAFIDFVSSGTKPEPSIEDGLQAQILADAATQSQQTGQPVAL